MTIVAVHQFHSGTSTGDAVTGQMLRLQASLRRLGYVSEVYAEHIDPGLTDRVRPIDTFADQPASLLLVHHSMGHTAFDQIRRIRTPIITVFHNITPPEFFDDLITRSAARAGFDQLQALADRSLFGVADSNHNRSLMYDAGFGDVEVLPVRSDFRSFRGLAGDGLNGSDWLFVGRIVPNKRQVELVEAFADFRQEVGTGHLHLVGDLAYGPYVDSVKLTIDRRRVGEHVSLHGKVSEDELLRRYREAALFVCLSEHEGFGIPLLEAMAAGLPVIASRSSAIAETMDGAGVLLEPVERAVLVEVARVATADAEIRSRIVSDQRARIDRLERFDVDGTLERIIHRAGETAERTETIQIEGPFETSYSLAVLNRELALALDRSGVEVTIHATEGYGDYVPTPEDLRAHPRAAALFEASADVPYPDVTIRQMYPPRVHDSRGGLTFQYFGWEETGLPASYVREFNAHLDGIGTMSTFVKDVLRANGVTVPIDVMGVGVRPPSRDAVVTAPECRDLRNHTFLHISSAFPRKGVDVLLEAYFAEFTAEDDVSLLLKTFPNPHNTVGRLLESLSSTHPAPPHVAWIDRDLGRDELDGLYTLADTYVHPARGEGFGLPVAEAMLAGVPVISTAATGLADFVGPTTATVIPHSMRRAETHLTSGDSWWAEPDRQLLREQLRAATVEPTNVDRVSAARSLIEAEYSWDAVAGRWLDFVHQVKERRSGTTIAAVTTFNSRCGIAEYSASLYGHMPDVNRVRLLADRHAEPVVPDVERGVERVWNHRQHGVTDLLAALDDGHAPVVHIQYNFGFFTLPDLADLIERARRGAAVVLTIHRTSALALSDGTVDSFAAIADSLNVCDAIIVHQEFDRVALVEAGVDHNVYVVPIGCDPPVEGDARAARRRNQLPRHRFIVGTYGFLLPHKGFICLLEAVAELRRRGIDAYALGACALHPDPSSVACLADAERAIDRLGLRGHVRLVTDYLDDAASKDLLLSADVIVLPYAHTEESSSAAARSVLPLCKPMITSEARIFDDLSDVVTRVPVPVDPSVLADELERLHHDDDARQVMAEAIRRRCSELAWPDVARQTREIYLRAAAVASDRRAIGGEP